MSTRARTHAGATTRYLWRSKRARTGLSVLAMLMIVSGLGSLAVDPPVDGRADSFASATSAYPLGTDARGRDVLAILLHGGVSVLGTAIVAVVIATLLGAAAGALAATAGGSHNRRLERTIEAVDTFPAIVVVALFRAIEESPSSASVIAAVALVKWAEVARIVRAETLRLSREDFLLSARALGATRTKVLLTHVWPHVASALSVSVTLGIASVVLLQTAVAFLGIGPAPVSPSWGEVLAQGLLHPDRPILVWAPALLLGTTVAAAYLTANALREALDPVAVRLRPKPGPSLPGPAG